MGATDLLPVGGDVGDIDARAHNVLHAGAGALQRGLNVLERLYGLGIGVTHADNVAVGVRCRGAGNVDGIAQAHGTRVAGNRLPFCSTGKILTFHCRLPPGRLSRTLFTRRSASRLYSRKTWSIENRSSFRTIA